MINHLQYRYSKLLLIIRVWLFVAMCMLVLEMVFGGLGSWSWSWSLNMFFFWWTRCSPPPSTTTTPPEDPMSISRPSEQSATLFRWEERWFGQDSTSLIMDQDYDTDKLFPALGFGARVPPEGKVFPPLPVITVSNFVFFRSNITS